MQMPTSESNWDDIGKEVASTGLVSVSNHMLIYFAR